MTGWTRCADDKADSGTISGRIGMPGYRADAMVGQGAGFAAKAVRAGRLRRAHGASEVYWNLEAACERENYHTRCLKTHPGRTWIWLGFKSVQGTAVLREQVYQRVPGILLAGGGVNDLRIAPFHILAIEGTVHSDQDHVWHMETIKKYITGFDDLFSPTEYHIVDVNDEASVQSGIGWWLALTGAGGEGMVVKPYHFIARHGTELLQPAIKCRGREYLRIIYGPEYTMPEHMKRLKKRGLNRKRQLALREFSLGMEALERFAAGEPLYRVHECVFAVLAFESEPVDPRL